MGSGVEPSSSFEPRVLEATHAFPEPREKEPSTGTDVTRTGLVFNPSLASFLDTCLGTCYRWLGQKESVQDAGP